MEMETLVVAHHRNQHQYNSRKCGHGSTKFGTFGSPPCGNLRGFNCRTFQPGEGLLPTPSKLRIKKTPVSDKALSYPFSPKTTPPPLNETRKISKGTGKGRMIDIPIKFNIKNAEGSFSFSERWAGPAYSNSPPPSSLPIPKFSLKPKRTVSLDLPTLASEFHMHPTAKSAPTTPTRERSLSPSGPFDLSDYMTEMSLSPCHSFDTSDSDTEKSLSSCDPFDISVSATMTLRRILNLDSTD